ncbi:hypothetical protein Tco_0890094 [Tanacetum coccineum]
MMVKTMDHSPGSQDGPPIMPEDPYAYIMAAYQEDEILPAKEQPLPAAADTHTADPPDMFLIQIRGEPDEEDEDPKEDPADYPADRDDDDDDYDDEDGDKEEEEEEHLASSDSVPPVHRMTARISIQDEPSISLYPA